MISGDPSELIEDRVLGLFVCRTVSGGRLSGKRLLLADW